MRSLEVLEAILYVIEMAGSWILEFGCWRFDFGYWMFQIGMSGV